MFVDGMERVLFFPLLLLTRPVTTDTLPPQTQTEPFLEMGTQSGFEVPSQLRRTIIVIEIMKSLTKTTQPGEFIGNSGAGTRLAEKMPPPPARRPGAPWSD